MPPSDKFSRHARAVAVELLGEPNKQLSSQQELRFGKQGSMSVDLQAGLFYDHSESWGGGVLAFVEQQTGAKVEGGAAVQWLRDHGYDVEDDGPLPRSNVSAGASGPVVVGGPRLDPNGNWLPQRVPDNGRLTKTFDYRTPDGEIAYQVCRYDWPVDPATNPKGHEKTFVQRRPDAAKPGGWTYKTKGLTPLLYRLPELLEDLASGRPCFVVEGEKKVDLLRELGVPATCNHGGAGKFDDALLEHLRGADVIVLPDNDDAGRAHADLIGRKLEGVAMRVRILDLPGLPSKGGVDDWLPAGGDADRLYDLVDSDARLFEAAPFKTMFGAVEWLDFDQPGPSFDYLVKGILTRGETSFLLGESQSGKSFLAIDIAMAIARGVDWFGFRTRQGGVIYQAGESATGVRRRRFPAYRQKHDCARDALDVVLLERPVDFFNSDDDVDRFIEECLHWKRRFTRPLELVIIDTFNKATPGANENDGRDMGMVLERCDRVRRATGAHVMLVHHLNAGGTKARGHTSLFANVENVITVRRVIDAVDGEGRKLREWVLSKAKDAEDGAARKFILSGVEIGRDAEGDPMTSCVVAEPAGRAQGTGDASGMIVAGFNAAVLRAVYDAVSTKGILAPTDLGLSRGASVVDRRDLWTRIREVVDDDLDDIRDEETEEEARRRRDAALRQRVKTSRDYLYSKGIIDSKGPWTWLTGKKVRGFSQPPGLGDAAQNERPASARPADDEPVLDAMDLPFDAEDFR